MKSPMTICLLSTLVIAFLSRTSLAQSTLPASGLSSALQAKAQATTFILDQTDSYCTVSPISKDGYMITALHCVRDCLMANGAGESGNSTFIGLQDLFVSTRSQATGVLCKDIGIPALGIKGITVVATGPAIAQFDVNFMTSFASLYNELKAHGFASRSNDYAILKVGVAHPLACWPLAANPAPANAKIWALGYPLPADIKKQKPVLSASAGVVYGSPTESRMYQTSTTADDKSYVQTVYGGEGVLYSNASNQFGQSGGPVIAEDGTLVGVVSGFTTVTQSGGSEIHEMVASTSASILKSMPPTLSAALTRASTLCR